jgi:hypothetical protein
MAGFLGKWLGGGPSRDWRRSPMEPLNTGLGGAMVSVVLRPVEVSMSSCCYSKKKHLMQQGCGLIHY